MPKYRITAPDGQKYDITAPEGATQEQVMAYAQQQFQAAAEPTVGDKLGYEAGRATRNTASGLAALPLMAIDALGTGINGLAAIPQVLFNPNQTPYQPYIPNFAQQKFQEGMSAAGLPQSRGELTDVIQSAQGGMFAPFGIAGQLRGAASPVAQNVGRTLALNPGAQASGATTGALAAHGAAAVGAGPAGQAVAGVVGGMLAPGSLGAVRAGRPLIDPLTEQGRRAVVGNTLRDLATDPEIAAQNLERAKPIVPGSRPTTGQAAGDYGLAAAERPIFETSGTAAMRAERLSEQNTARIAALDKAGISSDVAQRLEKQAEKVAGPMREAALENAAKPSPQPVIRALADIAKSPTYVRPEVREAVKFAAQQLKIARGAGGGQLDARRLYEARKSISQAIAGKYDNEKSGIKLAAKELMGVRDAIDESLNAATKGQFGKYLERYSRVAQGQEGFENAAAIRDKATTASPQFSTTDPTAQMGRFLSQPAMYRALQNAAKDRGIKILPGHQRVLDKVMADLDRGASTSNAAVRSAGSDTARNLTMSYVIGRMLSKGAVENSAAKGAAKVLKPIYGLAGTDEQLQRLLSEAMLDPHFAAQLMREANARNAQQALNSLTALAQQGAVGGTVATLPKQ